MKEARHGTADITGYHLDEVSKIVKLNQEAEWCLPGPGRKNKQKILKSSKIQLLKAYQHKDYS